MAVPAYSPLSPASAAGPAVQAEIVTARTTIALGLVILPVLCRFITTKMAPSTSERMHIFSSFLHAKLAQQSLSQSERVQGAVRFSKDVRHRVATPFETLFSFRFLRTPFRLCL